MLISLGTLGIGLGVAGGVIGGVDKYQRHKKEVEREDRAEKAVSELEKKASRYSEEEEAH